MTGMRTIFLLAAIAVALAACGIKGDPQPPKPTETPAETQQAQ